MTTTVDPGARIADALERIATALEQQVLEGITKPGLRATPEDYDPLDDLASLPPQQIRPAPVQQPQAAAKVPPQPAGVCPVHQTPWSRLVPGGVSKKNGKPYDPFWVCATSGCDQRPPR